jgi:hypothetical protein
MSQLRVACGALLFLLAQGCATTRPGAQTASPAPAVNLPAPYTQKNVKVVVEQLWVDSNENIIGVSGTATNTGSVNLLTCNIYLDVIDASGAKVSAAHATMIGLKSGQTWDFQAMFATPFAVTFRAVKPGAIVAMNER